MYTYQVTSPCFDSPSVFIDRELCVEGTTISINAPDEQCMILRGTGLLLRSIWYRVQLLGNHSCFPNRHGVGPWPFGRTPRQRDDTHEIQWDCWPLSRLYWQSRKTGWTSKTMVLIHLIFTALIYLEIIHPRPCQTHQHSLGYLQDVFGLDILQAGISQMSTYQVASP